MLQTSIIIIELYQAPEITKKLKNRDQGMGESLFDSSFVDQSQ